MAGAARQGGSPLPQPDQPAVKTPCPLPVLADLHTWAAELDGVAEKLAPRFERAEPRKRVLV